MDDEPAQPVMPALAAPPSVVEIQAWARRIYDNVKDRNPIAKRICIRTEFSGALTAEHAALAICNLHPASIKVDCLSMADWSTACQQLAALNCPSSCRFSNIMDVAPDDTRSKLEEPVIDKAGAKMYDRCTMVTVSPLSLLVSRLSYHKMMCNGALSTPTSTSCSQSQAIG